MKCGLRQGCPLSTTLFNLYIYDLHYRLAVDCTRTGIQLPHHPSNPSDTFSLRDLGYADDIALLATKPEHLQQLLDTFHTFCIQHGLQVNTTKCEIVVFGDRRTWRKHQWFIAGREIGRVDRFKYLGVTLQGSCRSGPIMHAIDHRLESMSKAQSCVRGRLKQLGLHKNPIVMAGMFDMVSRSAGDYGCEIWSTPWLDEWHMKDCCLQRYHTSTLKRLLGVRTSTCSLAVHFECGRYPLQVHWLARCIKYWNKLVTNRAQSSLLMTVLIANVHHGLKDERNCWARELYKGLCFAYPNHDWKDHMCNFRPIDHRAVVQSLQHTFCCSFDQYASNGDPLSSICHDRSHTHYCNLMLSPDATDTGLQPPAYLGLSFSHHRQRAMARFRLRNTHIAANDPRLHIIPYDSRVCTRCGDGSVDNEYHLLFECAAMEDVREMCKELLDQYQDVKQLMELAYNHDTAYAVSNCIYMFSCKLKQCMNTTGSNAGQM